jgi:hypothetical protein
MITIHKISDKTILYDTEFGKNGSMELNKMVAACGHGVTLETHITEAVEEIINKDNKGKRNKVTSVKLV